MALSQQQIQQVETVLRNSLRHKFQNYNPEPAAIPFHTRLLGKDIFKVPETSKTSFHVEPWVIHTIMGA